MANDKGFAFEYRVRRELIRRGWFVNSPKSNSEGPADLIAMRRGSILLIQCKASSPYISSQEADALLWLQSCAGGLILVCGQDARKGHQGIRIRELRQDGWHDRTWDSLGKIVLKKWPWNYFNVQACSERWRDIHESPPQTP